MCEILSLIKSNLKRKKEIGITGGDVRTHAIHFLSWFIYNYPLPG